MIRPIVLGQGRSLFEELKARVSLTLLRLRQFDCNLLLTYRPTPGALSDACSGTISARPRGKEQGRGTRRRFRPNPLCDLIGVRKVEGADRLGSSNDPPVRSLRAYRPVQRQRGRMQHA